MRYTLRVWARQGPGSSGHLAERGFSIIELIVCVALIGILTRVGIPAILDTLDSFQRHSTLQSFDRALARARGEAASKGIRVVFDITSSGYQIGYDYIPFSATGIADINDRGGRFASSIIASGATKIIFDPRGMSVANNGTVTARSVTFTDTTRNTDYASYQVYPTGATDITFQ